MKKNIILTHTVKGTEKKFKAVDKEYILMVARLICEEEAEDLLLNEFNKVGEALRYDLGIDLLTGEIKLKTMNGFMYEGYNTFIPVITLETRRGEIEFSSWIDDDLEALANYLGTIYIDEII